jgi:hypothetical protein
MMVAMGYGSQTQQPSRYSLDTLGDTMTCRGAGAIRSSTFFVLQRPKDKRSIVIPSVHKAKLFHWNLLGN